jgi:hypothetical protein
MRVVPVREGRYAPVAAAVPPNGTWDGGTGDAPDATSPPPLLRVRAPRIVAGPPHVEVAFEPDVLRLLMHPVAGHAEPLGRRAHPLGNAPVGAALTAALVAAGDPDPWRPVVRIVGARLTFYRALSLAAGWTARATVDGPSGRCRFEVAGTGAPLAVAGSVEWVV